MTFDQDRMKNGSSGSAFITGLFTGALLGAGLGLLFAPKSGSEIRRDLSERAERLQRGASDSYNQASRKITGIVDRGREALQRGRSAFERARMDRQAESVTAASTGR